MRSEWRTVRAVYGGAIGVYSLSQKPPLKTANFKAR